MRIKTVAAPNIKTALKVVRSTLGDDAVILSNRKVDSGVEVMASYTPKQIKPVIANRLAPKSEFKTKAVKVNPSTKHLITYICRHHRIPFAIHNRWLELVDSNNKVSQQLSNLISINDVWMQQLSTQDSLVFVGPPGAGKTAAVAKLAISMYLRKLPIQVLSMDVIKAGGFQQLQEYMTCLGHSAISLDSLEDLNELSEIDKLKLIDMPGLNIFDADDFKFAQTVINHSSAIPILVLPANLDSMAAAELSREYAKLGVGGIIFSQLDTTRRYGSVITASSSSQLPLLGFNHSPMIAEQMQLPSYKYIYTLLKAVC